MRSRIFSILVAASLRAACSLAAELHEVQANPDDSLNATLNAANWKSALRLELQRLVDARLPKIEKGEVGSGEIHLVHRADEVRALSGKLKPGDQLVLTGDEWKDARFSFEAHGTMASPIIVRPEKSGGAAFSSATEVAFFGEHLIITGLTFRRVDPAKSNAVIFRLGDGEKKPAVNCIVHRVTFDHCGSPDAVEWPRTRLWLMNVRGRDNTIAGCLFDGLKNIGQMIGAADLPKDGLQRLHVLGNHFRDRPRIDDQNGYEILQLGWSGEKAVASGSLIAGNTFERCDGENEIITLKASDIVVRGNRFIASQGVLCLRTSRRVLVQENVFDGQGRENTGGVRLQGDGHVIIGNIFRDLKKPKDYYAWPISLMAADLETYGETDQLGGYGRARDILIIRNRFEHCDRRIAAGVYARREYPLLPKNIVVRENVFAGTGGGCAFDFIAPDPSGELPNELRESTNTLEP